MEIKKLLEKIPTRMFDRGKNLLEEKRILEIKKIEKEIIDWSCTCPYNGDICKHAVAVLLEIAQRKNVEVKRKKRKTKDELAQEMVDKLSSKELKEFVKDFLQFDENLRDALLAQFSYYEADSLGRGTS